MKAGASAVRRRILARVALFLLAISFCAGCDVRPAESLEDGVRTLTESLGASLPDDARLVVYSGTRDGRQPVWVIRHQAPLTLSANADESICPVSSVAGILVDLRADPKMTGSIQGGIGRFARWQRDKWEFCSREVRTDLGLLSIIERFPTESNGLRSGLRQPAWSSRAFAFFNSRHADWVDGREMPGNSVALFSRLSTWQQSQTSMNFPKALRRGGASGRGVPRRSLGTREALNWPEKPIVRLS